MSKYTTEVRFICETAAGLVDSVGYSQVSEVIQEAVPVIFDFDFPIWDEEYRSVLCAKILKHYYTREIGFESVGLWKLKLDTKLNEIMPYYNERYKTVDMKYNPLNDVDYTRTSLGDENGNNRRDNINERNSKTTKGGTVDVSKTGSETDNATSNGTDKRTGTVGVAGSSSGSGSSTERFSDTPQGGLTDLQNDNYLTNATLKSNSNSEQHSDTTTYNTTDTIDGKSNNIKEYDLNDTTTLDTSDETNDSSNGSELGEFSTTKEYVEHVVGKMGNRTYASVIKEYRDALINIDMEVIDELKDLFMLLW